jgi:hypothetical protein
LRDGINVYNEKISYLSGNNVVRHLHRTGAIQAPT